MTITPPLRPTLLVRRACCLLFVAAGGLWPALAQPTNDNFSDRTSLIGTDINVMGSLANATLEPGEPTIPGVSSGQTAWWTWSAPANGILTLSTIGTGFSPLLQVYAGGDPLNWSLVASNNYLSCYTWCGASSTNCHWKVSDHLTLQVVRDQAYQIAVDSALATTARQAGWLPGRPPFPTLPTLPAPREETLDTVLWTTNILAGGPYRLGLHFTPAPTNDDFGSPVWLRGSRPMVFASNIGASREPGEPEHLGNPGGSSVWYAWTAPASGQVTLSPTAPPVYAPPSSSAGSVTITYTPVPPCTAEAPLFPAPDFFPLFAAYTGSAVNALTPANCSPLPLPGYTNAVTFDAVKGQTYHIAFDGNMGTMGLTPLYLALTQPAINNTFQHRQRLHGVYIIARGYNVGATHEAGEPAPVPGSTGKMVWWTWTAPVSGPVSLDLSGSDFAFPVAVYTGSTLARLSLVAANAGAVSFTATARQTYQIAISDAAGRTGAIQMMLRAPRVTLSLSRVFFRSPGTALLSYAAAPGLKVLLEKSNDGHTWQRGPMVVTHTDTANFLVRPPPSTHGPFYRATLIDGYFPGD